MAFTKRMAGFVLLLVSAGLLLFSEFLVSYSSPGWLRGIAVEVRAACRDQGTQWMVFVCAGIYFVTFTVLGKRGTSSSKPETRNPKRFPILQPSTFNLLSNADFWLCGLLLIAALHYAFNYDTASGSTQALMLMAGAAIGKGAGLWANWGAGKHPTSNIEQPTSNEGSAEQSSELETRNPKPETGSHQPSTLNPQPAARVHLLLSVMLLLLGVSALWHPEGAMQFQYRGLHRWSGPWDNPNIFGLLMGVGVVIGVGLLVSSFGFRVSRRPPNDLPLRLVRGEGRGEVSSYQRLLAWISGFFCLVALVSCAVGLLKSYSRGAWLGTALGLAWLAFQYIVLRPRSRPSSSKPGPLSRLSCLSRFACWLRRNAGPLSVVLLSVVILAFWQFRHTEFHPVRRAFSVGNKNDFSWRNRVAAWEGSLVMMADKPFTGFGWNKPERIYDQFYRPPKVSEGMAIQLNHYFTLGMSLGLPALICFIAYIGLSLTRSAERGTRSGIQPRNWLPKPASRWLPKLTRPLRGKRSRTTRNVETQTAAANSKPETRNLEPRPGHQPSTLNHQLRSVSHAAAVVLLVGLWFDGGLFTLATASLFWVMLEVGRVTAPTQPSTTNHQLINP